MKKKVIVLGANGMLGNALFISLINEKKFIVKGTIRDEKKSLFAKKYKKNLINKFDITSFEKIKKLVEKFKPNYLINCVGITNKYTEKYPDHYIYKINSFLPIYLSELSKLENFRLIHISTDCVFNGKKKIYYDNDFKSATDTYGISKSLGEEINQDKNSLIIRTSIIGHELNKKEGLLEWFFSQKKILGYDKVYYSGLTTVELSRLIIKILQYKNIYGLYQISSKKISKYKLLKKIKKEYNYKIFIKKQKKTKKTLVLDSSKFQKDTNLKIKNWESQIKEMKKFHFNFQHLITKNFL